MNNKALGGGNASCISGTSEPGQSGVSGGKGLNNIGLLVKTWGTITAVDSSASPQWFQIDDGSRVCPTVAYPPYGYAAGDYVCITGISSCEVDTGGNTDRVLRPQVSCTVTPTSGQANPGTTYPVNFTVTFSEPVSTLTSSGLTVSNGTATITGSGATYNVAVMPSAPGSVSVSVPGGVAFGGASGVWNSPSASSSVTFSPPVMYVDSSGDDTKCGWSWADAKCTIQTGITTAASQGIPAVWVAKGHYYEWVTVASGVGLYGGFNIGDTSAGGRTFPDSTGATDPSQATVIDGQGTGCVVTANGTNYMNTLDGFTVTNGSNGVCVYSQMTMLQLQYMREPIRRRRLPRRGHGDNTEQLHILQRRERHILEHIGQPECAYYGSQQPGASQ